eukprot:6467683-Amphidinium_carterae.1
MEGLLSVVLNSSLKGVGRTTHDTTHMLWAHLLMKLMNSCSMRVHLLRKSWGGGALWRMAEESLLEHFCHGGHLAHLLRLLGPADYAMKQLDLSSSCEPPMSIRQATQLAYSCTALLAITLP